MKLFEATNGWTGESYTRCYVWATNKEQALTMAKDKFKLEKNYPPEYHENVQIKKLLDAGSKPFCTEISDCGWK